MRLLGLVGGPTGWLTVGASGAGTIPIPPTLTLVNLLGQVPVTVTVAVAWLVGVVGPVLAADRPPGQLGVPALPKHPANQRPH
jgi:hypothetical protein